MMDQTYGNLAPVSQFSNSQNELPAIDASQLSGDQTIVTDPPPAWRKAPKYVPMRKEESEMLFASYRNGSKLRVCFLLIVLLSVIGLILVVCLAVIYYKKYIMKK